MIPVVQPREYRRRFSDHLEFRVFSDRESDLAVGLPKACWQKPVAAQIDEALHRLRAELEAYIGEHPLFLTTHSPLAVTADMTPLVRTMTRAATLAQVGPMAAVAGAIAEAIGTSLLITSKEVIVENGGDIFLAGMQDKTVGIYAGEDSPFTGTVGLKLHRQLFPLGVCTSSGTVGPSFSYGCADCATILARDTALADAVATASANRVHGTADLTAAVEFAMSVPGVLGALAAKDDQMAALGAIELVGLS